MRQRSCISPLPQSPSIAARPPLPFPPLLSQRSLLLLFPPLLSLRPSVRRAGPLVLLSAAAPRLFWSVERVLGGTARTSRRTSLGHRQCTPHRAGGSDVACGGRMQCLSHRRRPRFRTSSVGASQRKERTEFKTTTRAEISQRAVDSAHCCPWRRVASLHGLRSYDACMGSEDSRGRRGDVAASSSATFVTASATIRPSRVGLVPWPSLRSRGGLRGSPRDPTPWTEGERAGRQQTNRHTRRGRHAAAAAAVDARTTHDSQPGLPRMDWPSQPPSLPPSPSHTDSI